MNEDKSMAIEGEKKEIKLGDITKEVLVVSISNGALEQLESLKKFLGTDDPIEVIKAGIAFVQRVKEHENNHKEDIKKPEEKEPQSNS